MSKKKNKKKITLIIMTIISIILIAISFMFSNNNNIVETLLKDSVTFIQKIVLLPYRKSIKSKDQTESYVIQKNINASLEKEIEELKNLLELNKSLTEYKVENATVLSRNKSYWFNTLTIDKGKNKGIKKDMAVITKDGLIGKINKVYTNSSEVKLITSNDINFKVSVMISNNNEDYYAVLNGYSKKNNLLKVTDIEKNANINVGDRVVTSGLGKKFPAGIYIGTVEKIVNDQYDLGKILYIKQNQNYNSIHYVTVLKVRP